MKVEYMGFNLKMPDLGEFSPVKNVVGGLEQGVTKAIGAIKKIAPTGAITNMMKYPLEDQDDFQGRIVFEAWTQKGIDGEAALAAAKQLLKEQKRNFKTLLGDDNTTTGTTGVTNEEKIPFIKNCGQKTDTKSKTTSSVNSMPTGRAVQLYLQPSLQFQSAANYGPVDMGVLGTAVEAGINSGGGMLASAYNAVKTQGMSLIDGLLDEFKSDAGRVALARVAQYAPDFVEQGVRAANQVVVNPNTRLMFNNMGLRMFAFTFKMVPKSADEAKEIENIIKFFREEQHPEAITVGGIKAGYKFPNKFKITMYYGSKVLEPRIGMCYLQAVNVTYNGSSMAMHQDGKFSEYELTLTFSEERAIDKQDIKDGY